MSNPDKPTSSLPPRPSTPSLRPKFVQTVRPELERLTEADALAGEVQQILSSTPPIPRAPRAATGTGFRKKK